MEDQETGNVKRVALAVGGEALASDEIMNRFGLRGSGPFHTTYLCPSNGQGFFAKRYPAPVKRPEQAN